MNDLTIHVISEYLNFAGCACVTYSLIGAYKLIKPSIKNIKAKTFESLASDYWDKANNVTELNKDDYSVENLL